MNTYTDQQKAEALAALIENGGNVKATARELGIPRPTLITWREKSRQPDVLNTIPPDMAAERIALWDRVQEAGARRLLELFPLSESVREVAYAAKIAHDIRLDLTEGRRAAEAAQSGDTTINVQVNYLDAPQSLPQPL